MLCCCYKLTDCPISIRLTSLALWQSNDCPSASKATLMNMDKYFMWIHYERLHNHNKAKHTKTVCIFLGIYCTSRQMGAWHRCTHQMAYYKIVTLWNDDSWILFHTILYKRSAIICGVFLGVYTGLPWCTKSGSTRSVNPWDLHQTSTACDHNGPMSINYNSARNYW